LIAFSDENGDFTINAIENDSILFSSSFYEEEKIVINKNHLVEVFVVQLKEKINELDEIILRNNFKHKEFNENEFNSKFKNQLKNDVEYNLQAYEQPSNGLVDFRKISKRIFKLLKKKKKKDSFTSTYTSYASYDDLKLLFSKDNYINYRLIIEVLKIRKEDVSLFLDFCDGKIEKELLSSKNKFLLLDTLVNLTLQFKRA
jgi:hypothetical protein